jgi:hypothetical protein
MKWSINFDKKLKKQCLELIINALSDFKNWTKVNDILTYNFNDFNINVYNNYKLWHIFDITFYIKDVYCDITKDNNWNIGILISLINFKLIYKILKLKYYLNHKDIYIKQEIVNNMLRKNLPKYITRKNKLKDII